MRETTIDQIDARRAAGTRLVDVREPAEYRVGHIPGAVNIPMGQLTARLDELDRTQPVDVVCATGNRSGAMTDVLTAAGYDAANVVGGTSAWVQSGRPIEK